MRFYLVPLTALDDGRKHCAVLRTCIMACEKRVFTVEGNGPHTTLTAILGTAVPIILLFGLRRLLILRGQSQLRGLRSK